MLNGGFSDDASGSGDDTVSGGAGKDSMSGGDGIDTVSYADHAQTVSVSLDGVSNDGGAEDGSATETVNGFENAIGGSGIDPISGSPGANRLQGGPGNDVLDGGDGPDTLVGDRRQRQPDRRLGHRHVRRGLGRRRGHLVRRPARGRRLRQRHRHDALPPPGREAARQVLTRLMLDDTIDALFDLTAEIRYVAFGNGQEITLRQRAALSSASSGESDRF